jgi:hypothetical protein
MEKKIYTFINNEAESVPSVSKEIVRAFQEESNKDNVEYDFTIDGETKETKNNDSNTYFFFDTTSETALHDFKKYLFDEDLSDIEEGSEEEEVLMTDIRNFLLKVCNHITDNYRKEMQDVLRRVVLGGKYGEQMVPLETVEVVSIDIADYSSIPDSYKYILRIGKETGSEINTDEVIKFVQDRQEKTGMEIDNILVIEKKSGNPLFEDVLSIEQTRKFLNEVSIYFYVDYAINTEVKSS